MSKHYPVEQRERAVKMVLDHLDEYRSVYAACRAVGPKVGVGAEFSVEVGDLVSQSTVLVVEFADPFVGEGESLS